LPQQSHGVSPKVKQTSFLLNSSLIQGCVPLLQLELIVCKNEGNKGDICSFDINPEDKVDASEKI